MLFGALLASVLLLMQGASLPGSASTGPAPNADTVAFAGATAAPGSTQGSTPIGPTSMPTSGVLSGGSRDGLNEPSIVRPQPNGCQLPPSTMPAPVIHHGSRDAKVVALTFDDGYGVANTARILQILERSKVNATFLPVGAAVIREPDTWKAVAAAGFPIADHTYSHPNLASLCYADQVKQLLRQQAAVRRILGIDPMPLMRPPYGTYNWLTRRAATDAGDVDVVLWDIDTRDWSGISARQIAARALAGTNGSIILMHTMMPNTAQALPRIIASYRKRGFTFVTLGQLLGVPGPIPYP